MAHAHAWTRRHIKRAIWIVVICITGPMLISGGVLAYAFATGRWTPAQWLGLTGLFGLMGLIQLFWIVPVRRKIIAHGGVVCGNCLFALEGLPDEGVCPECGDEYEIENTIEGWESDFRMKRGSLSESKAT
ncbi:MAG: hypothetical protein Phyf2KO_26010 [Phycisphaerales bacterium]